MKTIEVKEVYKCEYCSKVSLGKGGIKTHEFYCKHNPNNGTPCVSCKHLIREEKDRDVPNSQCYWCSYRYFETSTGYSECTLEECYKHWKEVTFICAKTGKKMYYARKLRSMRKENKEAILSRCDCAMPCECELYNFNGL